MIYYMKYTTYGDGDLGKVGKGTVCHIGRFWNGKVSTCVPRSIFRGSMRSGARGLCSGIGWK